MYADLTTTEPKTFIEAVTELEGMRLLPLQEIFDMWRFKDEMPNISIWLPEVAIYTKREGAAYLQILREDTHGLWADIGILGSLLQAGFDLSEGDTGEYGEAGKICRLFTSGVDIGEIAGLESAVENSLSIADMNLEGTRSRGIGYTPGSCESTDGHFSIALVRPTDNNETERALTHHIFGKGNNYLINLAFAKKHLEYFIVKVLNPKGTLLKELKDGQAIARFCSLDSSGHAERRNLDLTLAKLAYKKGSRKMYGVAATPEGPAPQSRLLGAPVRFLGSASGDATMRVEQLPSSADAEKYSAAVRTLVEFPDETIGRLDDQQVSALAGLVSLYLKNR